MMLSAIQFRALEQVREAGRKGLQVKHGCESVTQQSLVEDGLIFQEHGIIGHWKFTLSQDGCRALDNAAPESE